MWLERWREIGDRIYVRRHESLDLNVGLIVGTGACLVIDTRQSADEGRELVDAVRAVTGAPWTVVNTHAHYDHFLGNSTFAPAPIWALDRCREEIAVHGEIQRNTVERAARDAGEFAVADALAATEVVAPTHGFAPPERLLDIGGRRVTLRHPGRGHTDNDIVVIADDVLFAGDLVEQGAPPSFEDAFPLEWPGTLDVVVRLAPGVVVPGHGDVVDVAFVQAQRAMLQVVADAARDGAALDDWKRIALAWMEASPSSRQG